MVDLPDDLPKLERSVVRIVALDAAGHVLLLHTGDSTDASLGTIDTSHRDTLEQDDCFESRWWTLQAITTSHERFYPGRLRDLLPRFLHGETIHEPFELWS